MHDEIATTGCVSRQGEVHAKRRGHVGAAGLRVDEGDPDARDAREQPGNATAHHPATDDGGPIADERRGIP